MRPIWFEFPKEEKLFDEEKAWMVGHALLVRAVVEKDTYNVNVELPSGEDKSTRWYDWETGTERPSGLSYVDAPITHIPVFQRGGTIVPTWQRIRRASILMLQDPLTLFVALDRGGNAKSTTSNDEAEFTGQPAADSGKYETETWIERIEVRGVERTPAKVSIIRASDPTDKLEYSYDRDRRLLTIRKPLVSINQSYKIIISF
ncbi:hypothetical protein COOONC_17291 [Cooperia oncophora]